MKKKPKQPVIPRPCQVCKVMFKPRDNHPKHKYCSRECMAQAYKTIAEKICPQCNKTFLPKRAGKRNQIYCSIECSTKANGLNRRTLKTVRTPRGYLAIYIPEHPMANKHGMILQHRMTMAEHLRRCLLPNEVVHHKNSIKDDNRIE